MSRIRIVAVAVSVLMSMVVFAQRTSVAFDVSPTVACRVIADEAFDREHPSQRLVRAEVEISAFVSGNAAAVKEVVYHLSAPERIVSVYDYLPRTTMVTDVVGNIDVQRANDSGVNAQLSVDGDVGKFARGSASLGGNRSRSSALRYEQLPPKSVIAAAGTIERGSGVYFKLKPSAQSSIEGARKFVVVFRVPRDWRADYLRVGCRAIGGGGRQVAAPRTPFRFIDRETSRRGNWPGSYKISNRNCWPLLTNTDLQFTAPAVPRWLTNFHSVSQISQVTGSVVS